MQGWHNYIILKDLLGDGIFTVDGQKWREQRKVFSHEFSARALRDVSSIIFRENAVKLANLVSEAVASNQPMDIQVNSYTLFSIIGFGRTSSDCDYAGPFHEINPRLHIQSCIWVRS